MEAHASESLYTNARGDFEGYVQGWSHLARSPIVRPRPLLSALPPQGKQEAGERAGEGARGRGDGEGERARTDDGTGGGWRERELARALSRCATIGRAPHAAAAQSTCDLTLNDVAGRPRQQLIVVGGEEGGREEEEGIRCRRGGRRRCCLVLQRACLLPACLMARRLSRQHGRPFRARFLLHLVAVVVGGGVRVAHWVFLLLPRTHDDGDGGGDADDRLAPPCPLFRALPPPPRKIPPQSSQHVLSVQVLMAHKKL